MNPLERLKIFHRVAELASFSQAAASLGLPKANASIAVQQLETELGTRLLHRTTRRVHLTQDGQVYYERSKDVLSDMDELQTLFVQQDQAGASRLTGRVRIDMSTALARDVVIPRLPELLAAHPLLSVELSSTERRVDLVREGFDCVLRTGQVLDSSLVARPLALLRQVNCASPAYLQAFGMPQNLDDLRGHRLIHFVGNLGAKSAGFEYLDAEGQVQSMAMEGAVTVNNAEAYMAACLAGLGIIQVPMLQPSAHVRSGALVEVLPNFAAPAMPLNLLYANRRNLSLRVRVVMDWLSDIVKAAQLQSPQPQSRP
ncbi:LysR family transcriptional regulator [Paucibacter sp. Y2R2-4]|uniref:LysR family transcriptional regulator n=1 Tax=Paucibacter sp. Y2R2-4 TaxID=2893553 RepID=UPI0021E4CFA9|nr:LysR family transcriptional regulator [Paucibacter sp. Y2R2-4]MCV2348220.1 LysR family transcriptional regulator [Paucibacter sp. Y2R2-4]